MEIFNCHIVALMNDRVERRKFGLFCKEETSNYDFIYSYINRLNCESVDMSCYDWQPCLEAREGILILCNLQLQIDVTFDEETGYYTFVVSILNGQPAYTYLWVYNEINHWNLISGQGTNTLILEAQNLSGAIINTNIAAFVTDNRQCSTSEIINVEYKAGCIDPEAINYDPLATFDNGTCYYENLSISVTYVCNEDDSGTVTVTPNGGLPPYTIVGTQDGAIVPNGSPYGAFVIDSLGNISPFDGGTIVCPFDCMSVTIDAGVSYVCNTDEFGFNTGTATLTISPSGGTAPYTIIGGTNGQIVNHLDNLNIEVIDANNCSSGVIPVSIDCPPFVPPIDITCEEVHFDLDVNLYAERTLGTPGNIFIRLGVVLSNLTPGVLVPVGQGADLTIKYNTAIFPSPCMDCLSLTTDTPCVQCSCTNCGNTTLPNIFAPSIYTYVLAVPGPNDPFSFTVTIKIYLQVSSGICEFDYSHTFVGNMPEDEFWGTTLIGTDSQSF